MKKISTDSIAPGDHVIAADVVSASGSILLNKGVALTPALGRRLRNWGITFVYIEGESNNADSDPSLKAASRSPIEIKSELYDIFVDTLDNACMKKIFDAVCKHKLQLSDGG